MNTVEKLSSAASGSSTLALRAIDISVSFGAFRALGNVDIAFDTGKVTALIGPNGAGKTTLMNVLSGLQKPSRGRVQLLGQDVTSLPAWKRARCGLMRSFQLVSVVPSFSVAGNVQLALLSDLNASAQTRLFCNHSHSCHQHSTPLRRRDCLLSLR